MRQPCQGSPSVQAPARTTSTHVSTHVSTHMSTHVTTHQEVEHVAA